MRQVRGHETGQRSGDRLLPVLKLSSPRLLQERTEHLLRRWRRSRRRSRRRRSRRRKRKRSSRRKRRRSRRRRSGLCRGGGVFRPSGAFSTLKPGVILLFLDVMLSVLFKGPEDNKKLG